MDDLLFSFDRVEYENRPYETLVFMMGSEIEEEPFGRHISDDAWNFDAEYIDEDDS